MEDARSSPAHPTSQIGLVAKLKLLVGGFSCVAGANSRSDEGDSRAWLTSHPPNIMAFRHWTLIACRIHLAYCCNRWNTTHLHNVAFVTRFRNKPGYRHQFCGKRASCNLFLPGSVDTNIVPISAAHAYRYEHLYFFIITEFLVCGIRFRSA
jgi:hypothetical protein